MAAAAASAAEASRESGNFNEAIALQQKAIDAQLVRVFFTVLFIPQIDVTCTSVA